MFANFLYFIIALLIYSTYQPAEETNFPPLDTLLLFLLLIVFFSTAARMQFRRLERRLFKEPYYSLDHKFNAALIRQIVMAIAVFAVDIYGLNLPGYFSGVHVFEVLPTLQALVFLSLFVFYLAIVWHQAHGVYQRLYAPDLSRRSYIWSNISFAAPVLLPWFLMSGILDLVNALPFEWPKNALATPQGEIIYFLFFLLFIAVMGPTLIQKFWQCRPLEPGVDRWRIEILCRKAGVAYRNILYWPIFGGRMITAGIMGLVHKFRYILVTDALLKTLEPDEIDAVIAHEIGHVKKKHLLFYLFFFAGYMLLSYAVFDLIIYLIIFWQPVYELINSAGGHQATVTSTLFSLVIIGLFLVYFRYIFGYFMRNFERQADAYVYTFFDSARPLIATFEKIARSSSQSPDAPNWHHFSITQRINFLKKCEADRGCVRRHDAKVRKSIAVYLAGILILGGAGYHLNFGESGKKLNARFFEKIILREIEQNPEDAKLYSILGDLYYSRKAYDATARAYERSLALEPDNPHVLNNLAWLYATHEDESARNPVKALDLARKAAALMTSPQILDTLAESYYLNGRHDAAVEAARRALRLARKNRAYYEGQLKKFMAAAGSGPRLD